MEPLNIVFHRTAKCHNPTNTPLSLRDVSEALKQTCGIDDVSGINITARSVEVTVTTDAAYADLLNQPAPLAGSRTKYVLDFEPAY